MCRDLKYVLDTDGRDTAASMMDRGSMHHIIVKNKEGEFVGILSARDICSEVAKDAFAWPFLRSNAQKTTGVI
jgi:CBS domain-containing protein